MSQLDKRFIVPERSLQIEQRFWRILIEYTEQNDEFGYILDQDSDKNWKVVW